LGGIVLREKQEPEKKRVFPQRNQQEKKKKKKKSKKRFGLGGGGGGGKGGVMRDCKGYLVAGEKRRVDDKERGTGGGW